MFLKMFKPYQRGKLLNKMLLILVLFEVTGNKCLGYVITVDALEVNCFFERVTAIGSKINFLFETIDGGFLDIDISFFDPDDKLIYKFDRENHGKFLATADKVGNYHYCFNNKMSTITPKVIRFDMEIVAPDGEDIDEKLEIEKDKLDSMLTDLSAGLIEIERSQMYVYDRDVRHHRINNDTNANLTIWAVLNSITMTITTIFQVYYLKSFFEVRRMV